MTTLIGVLGIGFLLQFTFSVVLTRIERRIKIRVETLCEVEHRLVEIGMMLSDLATADPPRMSVETIDLCKRVLSPPPDFEEGLVRLISSLEKTQVMLDTLTPDVENAR